jgi:hypothetical protein
MKVITSSEALLQKKGQAHRLHEEAGARCAFHPDVDATGTCSSCGKPVCYACTIETSHGCQCEHCVDLSASAPQTEYPASFTAEIPDSAVEKGESRVTGEPAGKQRPAAYVIPWEQRRGIGRQKALFGTWRAAIFSSSKVFSHINSGGGYFGPLLYGTVWILFGLAGGFMWRLSINILPKALVFIYGEPIEIRLPFSLANVTIAFAVAAVPLIAMLLLLAMCVVFHLFVVAAIRKHSGFKTTLRVICYSAGAFGFYFVPAAGGLLAGISQMMMVAIGFRQAHRASLPLAVAAAFLPCTLLLMAGLMFTSWAVEGSHLEAAYLIARLLAILS